MMLRTAYRHDPDLESDFVRQCLVGADEYNAEALMFAREAERLDTLPVDALSAESIARLVQAWCYVPDSRVEDELAVRDLIANAQAAGFAIVRVSK